MNVLYYDPKCASGSRVLTQITTVRQQSIERFGQPNHTQWKHVNVKVAVEGVLFFVGLIEQTGVAKNGVELHPVTGIR